MYCLVFLFQKCDSGLAVVPVPVLDSTFASDWQDQTVLPTNFVQVLNNNGTLMLMVTQPLGDQIDSRVENPVIDAPTNLESVTLDDNIYTVITDTSEQILHINNGSSILMSQPCSDQDQLGQVLTIQECDQTVTLDSDKNSVVDMDRVITMEGNVIMGVRNSSDVVDDKDDISCNEDHSHFLFVGEDSQTGSKEFAALGELPHTQSLKAEVTDIFSSEVENLVPEKVRHENCERKESEESLSNKFKTKKQFRGHFDQSAAETCQSGDKAASRKALRDAAQDIINMSYFTTNNGLLHEMVVVFEKYRRHLREEMETKNKIITSGHENKLSIFETSPRWESPVKSMSFSEKGMFSSINKNQPRIIRKPSVSKKKFKKSGGRLFSSSESSLDDYEDLIIND